MASLSPVTTTPQQLLDSRCPDLAAVDRFEILEPELTIETSGPGTEVDPAGATPVPGEGPVSRYRVTLRYRLLAGADEVAAFSEVVEFSAPVRPVASGEGGVDGGGAAGAPGGDDDDRDDEALLVGLARLIALTAGTSYYKVAAPTTIAVMLGTVTAAEAVFVRELYDHGMREFAARNDLPVPLEQHWELDIDDRRAPERVGPPRRSPRGRRRPTGGPDG